MNKINSRGLLTFFCLRNSSLNRARISKFNPYCSAPFYKFSSQQNDQNKQSNSEPKIEILEEEEAIQSRYLKKETFLERNKVTLGLALSSIGFYYFDFGFLSSALLLGSFISLWRAESFGLRLKKLYEDVNGLNNTRHANLNQLLARILLQEDRLKSFITKDGLCFSDMNLTRMVTHGQRKEREFLVFSKDHKEETFEHMQKKYRYIVRVFDITTGADGWVMSECVYNYDKDYYFRVIWLELDKPMHLKLKIADNRNTVDVNTTSETK